MNTFGIPGHERRMQLAMHDRIATTNYTQLAKLSLNTDVITENAYLQQMVCDNIELH